MKVQRRRKGSSFITGENHEYEGLAKAIRSFHPAELKKNESFLKEKVLNNQGFTKSLFDKRDFSCLATILTTNLATFKERMHHHGQLQAHFTTLYRENGRKEYEVAKLRRKMQQLQNDNERLKSRMIEVREENIRAYEESIKQVKKVVVIEEASSGKISFQDSGKVKKLVEHEEPIYEGYRESDLPIFRRVHELASIIREQEAQPDIVYFGKDFSEFGELFKPEEANPAIISKFLGSNRKHESCTEIEESIIVGEWRRESQEPKRANSMPKVVNVEQKLPMPSTKTSKKTKVAQLPETAEMPLFKVFGNPEESTSKDLPRLTGSLWSKLETKDMEVIPAKGLKSKYAYQKNEVLNPHESNNTSESFDILEMKHQRMTKLTIFKNSFRKR